MNDRALSVIVSFLKNYMDPIGLEWPDHEKDEVTFSHWVLDEILNLVLDHPCTLASEIIDEFSLKLGIYAAAAVTEDQKRIFTIAFETALDILEKVEEVEK